eukprot:CAMPEP_0172944522 /NCGR_PEP_ID=MMETSP1075-20121228/226089_1 /TAXON_ID=2916 /ORGANISM="Ceratium fusus, Strain PA161109" /LENGTH=200 /DNA_ID=CAMNT_0013805949 /DNA_START=254 /DNA_END=853 /DNA_ORIENTATION=+
MTTATSTKRATVGAATSAAVAAASAAAAAAWRPVPAAAMDPTWSLRLNGVNASAAGEPALHGAARTKRQRLPRGLGKGVFGCCGTTTGLALGGGGIPGPFPLPLPLPHVAVTGGGAARCEPPAAVVLSMPLSISECNASFGNTAAAFVSPPPSKEVRVAALRSATNQVARASAVSVAKRIVWIPASTLKPYGTRAANVNS